MLMVRACARYPSAPYRAVIERECPDVLHGHFAPESWRNIRIVRSTGLPLVTTFYGLDVDKLWRRTVWHARYRTLFAEGSSFVCEGPYMASRLESFGCDPAKIRVIYQAADIEKISRHRPEKSSSTLRVLFVGLSRYKKGAEDAVKAFIRVASRCRNVELHLAGDGPYRTKTQALLRKAGMTGRAAYHGFLDTDAYLSLLGSCDILCAPSVTGPDGDTEGGAPVCVIEALAAGIPVVATTHCDIPNIVVNGETGLLCSEGDVEACAAHLERLVTDGKLRRDMGDRARETAPARHDIAVRVNALALEYERLAQVCP
jgi:colanic acid/amylovoran biosynthesis glycosyltransferase